MANETIKGKIFTLKDPTGTYDRFPRTVMEAVYGLIPYLQNQFGALADIYMPIEGITDSKPLQEFVYRLCPSSIKAKSVSLDRIYGKTLAWNQLVQNGDFSNGTNNWSANEGTISASNGVLSYTVNSVGSYDWSNLIKQFNAPLLGGHKYYISLGIKAAHNKNVMLYFIAIPDTDSNPEWNLGSTGSGSWAQLSKIVSPPSSFLSHEGQFQIGLAATSGNGYSVGDVDQIRYVHIHDLTLLYGNEIDGMTDAEILAKYEAEYPGYHEAGNKLISNDAESMETVGFNQWDEEWEKGYWSNDGGEKEDSEVSLRSKNKIDVSPNTTYCITYPAVGSTNASVVYFDRNGSYIGNTPGVSSGQTFTTPVNCYKIAFTIQYYISDVSSSYSHDICINLSDPAKNGTYEPYRKSTMQLNLGSFQVRDSQGNVTTITGGLKSAGSVKDEIVGNKYIQRVGRQNLGDLTWTDGTNSIFRSSLPLKKVISGAWKVGGVCSWYTISPDYNSTNTPDKCFSYGWESDMLFVHDSAYSQPTFKTAMNGVYLDYELATPIEYELVSPLVSTVKAGETEARISPNSDGLSAPMVADMTYDAQANNDSASAQYALTAGRLLNSHKLWGQDFDGTQDVAGALTGVTSITMNGALSGVTSIGMSGAGTVTGVNSINSLINISGTNVGIGKSPSVKLDVNGGISASDQSSISITSGDTPLVVTTSTDSGSAYIRFNNGVGLLGYIGYSNNQGFYVQPNNTTKLVVLANGNVGINRGNPSYNLDVSGTFRATGAATFGSTIHAAGGIDSDSYITAGAVNSSSDARLKNNITSVVGAMETIMALKPSEWIWNEKHHLNGQKGAGLVAQEVEKVLPFAVAKEGEYLSLNYDVFHAYEIAGLQNHEERIKALEAENAELRRRLGA